MSSTPISHAKMSNFFLNRSVPLFYRLKANQIRTCHRSSRKHTSDVEKGDMQLNKDTQRSNLNSIFKCLTLVLNILSLLLCLILIVASHTPCGVMIMMMMMAMMNT